LAFASSLAEGFEFLPLEYFQIVLEEVKYEF